MNQDISRRYHEAELYLRQSHAERDLESSGTTTASFPLNAQLPAAITVTGRLVLALSTIRSDIARLEFNMFSTLGSS
jgi:hypothetical protein